MPDTTEGNIVEVKEHVDVLDSKGNSAKGESALADIFNKIESGKNEGKTAKEVVGEITEPKEQKQEPKKQEKVVEKVSPGKEEKIVEKKEEKDIPARDKLFRDTDLHEEKKEEKKVDKQDDPKGEEVDADELQVLPNDKPRTAKRIQALLKKIEDVQTAETTTKKELEARDVKLKELTDQLGKVQTVDPKTAEEIQKTKDELAMFRRRYALDSDPDVKAKFDGRAESAEKAILETLNKHGAGEGILNIIKEEGGWTKFAESGRSYKLKSPIERNGKEVDTLAGAEFADLIVSQLPITGRRAIDAAMVEQVQTKRDKERFFQEEQGKANDYFKKQDEESKKRTDAQQNQIKEVAGVIEKWEKDITSKNSWLQEKEIPSNATAEQKAAIEDDNKYAKQLKGLVKEALSINKVEDSLSVIFDSVRYYQERREKAKAMSRVSALEKELAAKQLEIDKFKRASGTTRGGSISGGGSSKNENKQDSSPKSLEDALDAISRGESVGTKKGGSDDE